MRILVYDFLETKTTNSYVIVRNRKLFLQNCQDYNLSFMKGIELIEKMLVDEFK